MALPVATSPRVHYLALGAACVAIGVYKLADGEPAPRTPVAPARAQVARIVRAPAVARPPALELPAPVEPAAAFDDDAIRGYELGDDPAEFAFVFDVDGVSYVRLADDERAAARGEPRLFEDEEASSVVAPVDAAAMPAHLRAWAGREVWVDGTCRARVVGFAEVSRASGEPPDDDDDDDYDDADDADRPAKQWTIASVTAAATVMLAARLDGCAGTWARATSHPAAAVAAKIDAPALEAAARRAMLAPAAADTLQRAWAEQGGEGDWRDAAEVSSSTYQHALTDERWVIVRARRAGGCGEPGFDRMAVYRATAAGTVRHVADLDDRDHDVLELVDLDGDGQPELIMGDGGTTSELLDLAGADQTSISVPSFYDGCGC